MLARVSSTPVLEGSKITLLIHSAILGLHEADQNQRRKLPRIRYRAQLGPKRAPDTDPLRLRIQDSKERRPSATNSMYLMFPKPAQ